VLASLFSVIDFAGGAAMKYGIAIRNMGPQSNRMTIRACARIAEQAGFDALFVSDHLCIPPDQTEGSGGRYLDVLATLAFIAGATDRIRLGVSVLVVPYRPAVLTAKQVATIQELSGERMILGVGVGWMKPEFDALGVNIRRRGAITDETLSVIHHLFSADVPGAYDGPLVKFPSFVFLPRPKRPPIWVGGNGPAAMNRAIKFGDGWHPMLPATELKAKVEELQTRARSAGRPAPEIVVRRGLKLDDIAAARAKIEAERDAGTTYFIFDLGRYPDEQSFGKSVETFRSITA
jgi:probable F420-dependent oxidoreductase